MVSVHSRPGPCLLRAALRSDQVAIYSSHKFDELTEETAQPSRAGLAEVRSHSLPSPPGALRISEPCKVAEQAVARRQESTGHSLPPPPPPLTAAAAAMPPKRGADGAIKPTNETQLFEGLRVVFFHNHPHLKASRLTGAAASFPPVGWCCHRHSLGRHCRCCLHELPVVMASASRCT